MLFLQNQQVFALLLGVVATTTTFAVTVVSASEEGRRGGGGERVASASGGIRGRRAAKKVVSPSSSLSFSFPKQQDLPEIDDNRQLKKDKNDNAASVPAVVNAVAAPTAAPVLTGTADWAARCARERHYIDTCVGNPRTPEACHNCLYSQSFLSTANPNLIGCINSWCGTSDQCKAAAQAMFNCGARIVNIVPTPAPVAPVTVVVPTAPPVRGPLPIDTGSTTCSNTVPISGDSCDAGVGNSYMTCCYSVNFINGAPPPTEYAHVCTCAAYENRYLCNGSTIHHPGCTSLITPSASTPIPVVPAPTTAPVVPVVVAPTAAPVPAAVVPAVPATTEPVVPAVPVEQGSVGCPPEKAENGASCAGTVPEDKSAIGCGYIEQSGSDPNQLTETKSECVCDTAVPSLTWACTTLETTTPAPAPPSVAPPSSTDTFCPSQDNPPEDGSSCEGILPVAITEGTCTFSQSMNGGSFETKKCTCVLDNPVWSCIGDSFSPVPAPVSFMPAGQTLPTSSMPVPATPGPPTETTTCPTSFPGDGTSCEGVLKGGLANASCNFSQTVTTNGVPVSESATCGCAASDEIWNCQGTISSPPPNATPAVTPPAPAPVPVVPAPTTVPVVPVIVVAPTATPVSVVTTAAPVPAVVVPAVPATTAEPVVVPAVPATAQPVVPAVPVTAEPVPAEPVVVVPAVPATDAPVVPVPPDAGTGTDIPAGCPPNKVQNGSSCANTVPADKSAIGCGYIEQSGSNPMALTESKILCVCDTAIDSLTWDCNVLETTTPAPAPPSAAPPSSTDTFCPSQDNPPNDGSSCEGILPVAITEGTCTFSQSVNGGPFESKKCTCVLDNPVWSCVGDSFSPVQAPVSLMPAGQTLPTSSMPVPATPGPPTETTQCPPSFPGDGTSCAGVLKGGLAQASCSFSQTVTTNGVPVSESATCGCAASDEIWKCEGTISAAPPNAVPVVTPPTPVV